MSQWNWTPNARLQRRLSEFDVGAPGGSRHRQLVQVACALAELALDHEGIATGRPREVLALARRWASGDPAVTTAEVARAATTAGNVAVALACDAIRYRQPWRIAAAAAAVVGPGVLSLARDAADEARLVASCTAVVSSLP